MASPKEVTKRLKLLNTSEVTLVDQWRVTIIPKTVLGPKHKLRSKGSHPQRVTDESWKKQIAEDLLGSDYRAKDEPVVGEMGFEKTFFGGDWVEQKH